MLFIIVGRMNDSQISALLKDEQKRQEETITLIPSENYASEHVRNAVGSLLMNKYSEGYPGARYYQGNGIMDDVERLAISRAQKVFDVPHANVQPYSGSPANMAVYFALLNQGDVIMGMGLSAGGHLTHGHPAITFPGKYFTSVQYGADESGYIDMKAAVDLASKHKPKLIIAGFTSYTRNVDWKAWRKIADAVGAYLLADISHIAGLIAGGALESPAPHAHIITTTTHKTLRGPRGALIMATHTGLKKDPDLGKKLDRAVFPGLQGGPHNNTTAGIAVALHEVMKKDFAVYAQNVLDNARTLAHELSQKGLRLVTEGTDNHMVLIDLRPQNVSGNVAAEALEDAGIIVNRNSVPHDPNPPFYPSGIRVGSPAVTTRGMGRAEMKLIAGWISDVIDDVKDTPLPDAPEDRKKYMQDFRKSLSQRPVLKTIRKDVKDLCSRFPIPE